MSEIAIVVGVFLAIMILGSSPEIRELLLAGFGFICIAVFVYTLAHMAVHALLR